MKEGLETIKAGIDNVKAAGIIGLIVFAIFNPTAIKWWMKEADIKKLGPSGVETRDSNQATDAVTRLLGVKAALEAQLTSSNKQIEKQSALVETLDTPQASQLVAAGKALIAENEKGIKLASNATLSAQKVIIANAELIPTNSQWIIMVGSDTTLESAEVERNNASNKASRM